MDAHVDASHVLVATPARLRPISPCIGPNPTACRGSCIPVGTKRRQWRMHAAA
ncbi:hypothetical protein BDA96_07G133100 [Sorghum bicolor]|uniref:Uncharacterized protein n=1 Tax=Sorghum bicolor TaxID=4558 RepID=A0A921QJT4_SORBI|nr:hypothetical protein BDA96_07G133100 [Sorghum bicolor]